MSGLAIQIVSKKGFIRELKNSSFSFSKDVIEGFKFNEIYLL